jgi:tRNA-2-methylthio-N6-dimethylallyladenosine synthase
MPAEWTIPDEVASDRLVRLVELVRSIARDENLTRLGQRVEVLVEKFARKGEMLQARTRDFKTVLIHGDESLIGTYLNVELSGTTGSAFTGQVVKERQPLAVLA